MCVCVLVCVCVCVCVCVYCMYIYVLFVCKKSQFKKFRRIYLYVYFAKFWKTKFNIVNEMIEITEKCHKVCVNLLTWNNSPSQFYTK